MPPLRIKRSIAAFDRDDASVSTVFGAAPDIPIADAHLVVSSRTAEGPDAVFLSFASKSSRTRGQPVTG